MKKSEQYTVAMLAVLKDICLSDSDKLEVIETLMSQRGMAQYSERMVEGK